MNNSGSGSSNRTLPLSSSTPEFLRWALEQSCGLRWGKRWSDPERTERQLRALRAYSTALAEERVFEGVCVEAKQDGRPELGFLAAEVLEAYGGRAELDAACPHCPAHVLAPGERYAGCYGLLEKTSLEPVDSLLEAALQQDGLKDRCEALFPQTRPRWYGLWIESPPTPPQRTTLLEILEAMLRRISDPSPQLKSFLAALRASQEHALQVHWKLEPEGRLQATQWIIPPHCARCQAPASAGSAACSICGRGGRPLSERRRKARGNRPYWELERFLGPANVAPFVDRYLQRPRED